MVAHLVRLQLLLLRNGLKRRPSQLIGLGIGVLYGGFAVVGACGGLVALRLAPDPRPGGALVTVVGSVLVLAWVVVPLFVFGTDPTLDPRRFATFAISSRQLALGLAASALVGLPALATSVVALMTIVTWSTSLLSALVAAVLVVGTCILASRVATAWASAILTSRRGRDAIVVATMLVILGYASVASRLGESDFLGDPEQLVRLGEVVGWTPMGWAWAAPWAVAQGTWRLG